MLTETKHTTVSLSETREYNGNDEDMTQKSIGFLTDLRTKALDSKVNRLSCSRSR